MNVENVKAAIAGMKKVRAVEDKLGKRLVSMEVWQDIDGAAVPATSLATLAKGKSGSHECGTAACLAGHMTLMPHFQKLGLTSSDGPGLPLLGPKFAQTSGAKAIAELLGISGSESRRLCAVNASGGCSECYGKDLFEITSDDVISKLERLLETGEVENSQ